MSERKLNEALMRRFYEELWSRGNLGAIPELVAEDFVEHRAPTSQPRRRERLADPVDMWRTGFPDRRETVKDLISDGVKVIGSFLTRGTHQVELMGISPTGRSVTMDGPDFVRVAGGRIAEFWYAEQMLELMRQLGAVPAFDSDRTEDRR